MQKIAERKYFLIEKFEYLKKGASRRKKGFDYTILIQFNATKHIFPQTQCHRDFDQHYFNLYEGIVDVEKKKGMKKEEEEENK